jgi:hypothetical protein
MDPARIGECRIGYCRIGVTNTLFDDTIEKMEQISIRNHAASIEGVGEEGYEREGVIIPLFDVVVEQLETK